MAGGTKCGSLLAIFCIPKQFVAAPLAIFFIPTHFVGDTLSGATLGSIEKLYDKKQELQNIRKYKIQAIKIRSRVNWLRDGEKPS